jgi:hypothetical protein
METFRGCVFDVPHVEIKPPAVEEKPAVTRWLFVIPIMKIDGAGARLPEKVILYLGRPQLGAGVEALIADKAAVFGLDPDDPIHRLPASNRPTKPTREILRSSAASGARGYSPRPFVLRLSANLSPCLKASRGV